jgi:hypothetical protein
MKKFTTQNFPSFSRRGGRKTHYQTVTKPYLRPGWLIFVAIFLWYLCDPSGVEDVRFNPGLQRCDASGISLIQPKWTLPWLLELKTFGFPLAPWTLPWLLELKTFGFPLAPWTLPWLLELKTFGFLFYHGRATPEVLNSNSHSYVCG